MDIRDIKTHFVSADWYSASDSALTNLFKGQQSLVDRYVGVEKLPKPPLEINIKAHQVILKDFISRVVEELGEAYESYLLFTEGIYCNKDIINSNEELMDALHFLLETGIYCGLTAKDVELSMGETLEKMWDGFKPKLSKESVSLMGYSLGMNLSSTVNMVNTQVLLWRLTYKLQLVRNCLKNKPWKQSEMMSDIQLVRKLLLESFREMFTLLFELNFPLESIMQFYYMKNQVNHFRISSNY